MTKTKETLTTVRDRLASVADSVGYSRKDDAFVAKRGYFYRHGMDADKLADAVKRALLDAVVLEASDHWNPWPRDSWFEVRFRLTS